MGIVVDCYKEKHEFESVSGVVAVQRLDQEGDCESRLLSFRFLIPNSRLGELNPYCKLLVWLYEIDDLLLVKFELIMGWIRGGVIGYCCIENFMWIGAHDGYSVLCILLWYEKWEWESVWHLYLAILWV